jgi:hypothetical protein
MLIFVVSGENSSKSHSQIHIFSSSLNDVLFVVHVRKVEEKNVHTIQYLEKLINEHLHLFKKIMKRSLKVGPSTKIKEGH